MRQKSQTRQTAADKIIKDIRRATRKQYSAEQCHLGNMVSMDAVLYFPADWEILGCDQRVETRRK